MKYTALFFICPYWGHILPVIPIVKELKKNGHKIVFYSIETFYQFLYKLDIIVERYKYVEQIQLHINYSQNNTSQLTTLMAAYKRRFDEQLILEKYVIEELEKYRPNYIVYDYFDAYWAKVAAEKGGIINIASVPTFAIHPNLVEAAPEMCIKYILNLNEKEESFPKLNCRRFISHINSMIRYKYNASEFDLMDYGNSRYLNLIHTSNVLQPFSNVFPSHFKFIGLDTKRHSPTFEEGSHFRFSSKTIIYISMGTVEELSCLEIYRKCILAYKNTNYQVIMSIGRINPKVFGDIPENIGIYSFLPQGKILKMANLFISHGGMNSVNEALLCGVPMILIPRVSDQYVVANQVVEKGGGVIIPPDFSVSMLIDSTIEVLKKNYSESSHLIGETLRQSGGGKKGVKEILKIL